MADTLPGGDERFGNKDSVVRATLCSAALVAALIFSCLAGVQRAAAQAAPPADVAEEPTRLDVMISGKAYVLDELVVRRPGEGRLPVALITHGANPGNPRGADLDWLRGWAHELAHRGWLAVAVNRSRRAIKPSAARCWRGTVNLTAGRLVNWRWSSRRTG